MDVDTPPLDGRLAICLGGGSTVLKDCVAAVEAAPARSIGGPYRGGAAGLVAASGGAGPQALSGMALATAATLVAELGISPASPMSYLGLVPSERSSGTERRQGGVTIGGNGGPEEC